MICKFIFIILNICLFQNVMLSFSVQNWFGDVEIVKEEPVRKNRFLRDLQDEEGEGDQFGEGEKDRDTALEGKGKIS